MDPIARHARCNDQRGSLTRLFFSERAADITRAKAICLRCTVRERCLELALDRQEMFGVWGGEELVDGVIVGERRRRGRPRKHALPAPFEMDEITGERVVA
jgi:WhiB family redox-sensing transcriptional regulator